MNAVRLAIGTLTVFPTSPPTVVNRRVAGNAMMLAPVVGGLLCVPLWALSVLVEGRLSPLLVAVLWVGGLALLTRAMHLDGLADTADGLGSGKPAEEALAIMRRSDIGPFGTVTIVLVLLAQVGAAAQLVSTPDGVGLVAAAVVWSRLVVPFACLARGAREDGLGATVAVAVSRTQAMGSTGLALLMLAAVLVVGGVEAGTVLVGSVGGFAGLLFCDWCVRRLGGITGDVIGACVEVSLTTSLLAMCLA